MQLTRSPELVVLLRGGGTAADRERTLDALKIHTAELEVYFQDSDADNEARSRDPVHSSAPNVCVVGAHDASGAVDDALVWALLSRMPEADVVFLEVGVAVGPNWVETLRTAVHDDAIIATASAIPTSMLALSEQPSDRLLEIAVGFVRGAAVEAPVWGCVYLRRDAVKVAMQSRWYGDERHVSPARLEELIVVPGMVHVLASTIVQSAEAQPAGGTEPLTPALNRALAEVEGVVQPLRVLVDMRCCMYPLSGTQVHALNLVSRLARSDDLSLSILMPLRPDESVRPHLDRLPANVVRYREGQSIDPPPQVFHRPYQFFEGQINDVVASGARLVVTHQDMILDRTPVYFRSKEQWRTYAAATALSFVVADEVVFYSEHARQEALSEGLLDKSKTSVVAPGTDHLNGRSTGEKPLELATLTAPQERAFLLFIGNNYMHKNRLFALRVAEVLERNHGWEGALVCVGEKLRDGASVADESAFWRDREHLRRRFFDLGRVTDPELQWLYGHAGLVLFPTLYEGFGLIPFEAAGAGTPCVYSARSSVGEYLPSEGALLDLGDVPESASRVQHVLQDSDLAVSIVEAIRRAGEPLTWARAADSYADIYRRAMARPVGLSLVMDSEISVGARSEMASTEVERRILLVLRRSPALRRVAERTLTLALAARRAVRRL
jgi:glycosyltransferase involved in cell wall biosynthesis